MIRKGWYKRFNFNADTGFGNSANAQGERLVNNDGSFNVIRKGLPLLSRVNLYHDLIRMKWNTFNLWVLFSFIVINFIFTLLYIMAGTEQLQGLQSTTPAGTWFEVFTFSAQTFSTVGYGRINPVGHWAGAISTIESLVGIMVAALLTGLVFARFARPNARLAYSKWAIIAPYTDINALMFRVANERNNQLVECEGEVLFSFIETESNLRRFITLELERKRVTSLALSWTIVHPINDNSPLKGLSLNDLKEMDAEFIFIFKGFDDTYSQTVYTRNSYHANELIWGAKFTPMFNRSSKNQGTELLLHKISDYSEIQLNPERAGEISA